MIGQSTECGGNSAECGGNSGMRRLVVMAEWTGMLILELILRDTGGLRKDPPIRIRGLPTFPPDVTVKSVNYLGTTHRLEIFLVSEHWKGTKDLRFVVEERQGRKGIEPWLRMVEDTKEQA